MPALKPLLSIFALLSAASSALAQQQTDPPPPLRYDRPRAIHRAPREDSLFNTGPVMLKGIEIQGGWLGGRGLEYNVPDALAAGSSGGVTVQTVRLVYDDKMDFESIVGGFTLDLNLFRLSLEGMHGRWQGSGTLSVSDGVTTTTTEGVGLHGDFWGTKGGFYWPALRYRSGVFEASLGPQFDVAWYYQGLHGVDGSPLRITDKQDELLASIAPHLSIRFLFSGANISLDAQLPYVVGAVEGWTTELSLGIGLRF